MEKLTRKIVDCTTSEETIVELTDEEVAQYLAKEKERLAEEAKAQALADLKASAKAKLIAGKPLTAEEADTLVL